MSIWTDAQVQPVYYRMGNIKNDQRAAYVIAPFKIVKMDNGSGASPQTYVSTGGTEMGYVDIISSNNPRETEFQSYNGWGYITNIITLEYHQMGDGDDNDWTSVHAFGLI